MTPKQRATEDRKMLREAARLLFDDAGATRESCKGNGALWACGDCQKDQQGKCRAQRLYDQTLRAGEALLKIARRPTRRMAL